MRERGICTARQVARALVRRLGISRPEHIRIEAIARRLGARVREAPLDGASAQLVRSRHSMVIVVAERVSDMGARRFSIAHELGHLLLDHPSLPPSELNEHRRQRRCTPEVRDIEAEANAFASELLMPVELVRERCESSPLSLEVAHGIAREFTVSILTSAIRVVELTSECCAVVFSSRNTVRWVVRSAALSSGITRGRRLDRDSHAAAFFEGRALDEHPQRVPAEAWFDAASGSEIVEHSIGSRELGTVLSLLWVPENARNALTCLEGSREIESNA